MSVITEMYREMGIRNSVVNLGKEIEATLKERFDTIDEIAEYNQLKVVHAMQKNHVSEPALNMQAAMDMMIWDVINWKKFMPMFSIRRVRWFVHRSPAERMHWRWLCQPISVRGMNWYPWPASHTIHWKK